MKTEWSDLKEVKLSQEDIDYFDSQEKNFFEGAKFGDKFVTRDGRIVCYTSTVKMRIEIQHWFASDNVGETFCVDDNGITFNSYHEYDIVSRYQEPIDEQKLDELASKCTPKTWQENADDADFILGFKTGYRKAIEG